MLNAYLVDAEDIAATEAAGPVRGRKYTIYEDADTASLIAEVLSHPRVGQAKVRIDGLELSVARSGCAAHS